MSDYLETKYTDLDMVEIYYKGKLVYSWFDGANSNQPEDLVWSRDLQDIFYAGIELGKIMEREK